MLRITTLSENTAGHRKLLGEWGLSILLETGESNILFDCGQTISAVHNADALNIDLTKVNRIVLSHGHYDHTGGLPDVLKRIGREIGLSLIRTYGRTSSPAEKVRWIDTSASPVKEGT